jgi:hypothetical protein
MEDKLHFFKRQKVSLWEELKTSEQIQSITKPFYIKDTTPQTKTVLLPKNICKIYTTLVGGGGSGSLGEYRRFNNSLENSNNVDTGYLNAIPLPGCGGGGGATIFRLPILFIPKLKTEIEYTVGQGGEERSIQWLRNPFVQDSLEEKEFRKGRSGTESKIILRQYNSQNQIIKQIKLKAMGGAGGGVVGYFTSRSDIIKMDSSAFQYVWDWSAVSDMGQGNFTLLTNWPLKSDGTDLIERHQYWSSLLLDPSGNNVDKDGKSTQKSEHFSVAAEHYTAISQIPAYVKVAFHQELRYQIADNKNDYIAYNLLTHGVDGISRFEILKPDSVLTINGTRGYFGNNVTPYGNYEVEFPLTSNSSQNCFNLIYQYQPLITTDADISIAKRNIYRSQNQPLYYLRTGTKYYYKDRSVAFRYDLTLPYDSPLREKMYITCDKTSLTLDRWSSSFRYLMEQGNGPLRTYDQSSMLKGERGAFGGAGGGFLQFDDAYPMNYHGLSGGKGIDSRWGIPKSGSGGNPYPRMIVNAVDLKEFNRVNAYGGAYYYYGGMGYQDANSVGEDSLITCYFIPGSGGGSLDYLNFNNFISNRKFSGSDVDFKEIDPEVTESRSLKSFDGVFKWHVENYNNLGIGGKNKYIQSSPENPISKLYINDEFGRHNISLNGANEELSQQNLSKSALLTIYGGGGGGGKSFRFTPGDGQESIFMDPSPAGIGCGSGGSVSMNEDGQSAVRIAPYGTVNWYLNRMLNNANEMSKYYGFSYALYTTSITTIVSMVIAQILLSILIEVLTAGVAGAVSRTLNAIKTGLSAGVKGLQASFKATKFGVKVINAFSKVSQWFAKIGSKIGKGFLKIGSRFKTFATQPSKLKTFGLLLKNGIKRGIRFIGKKVGSKFVAFGKRVGAKASSYNQFLLQNSKRYAKFVNFVQKASVIVSKKVAWLSKKVYTGIKNLLSVVLFNDYDFLIKNTKFVKAFKAANKIAEVTETIAKLTAEGGEALEKIPKLQKKADKLKKIIGVFGDLDALKKSNPRDYALYKWFNSGELAEQAIASSKALSKSENQFKNFLQSSFDVTADRENEIKQIASKKLNKFSVLYNEKGQVDNLLESINKDLGKMKNLGEKRIFAENIKNLFGNVNFLDDSSSINQFMDEVIENADLFKSTKYQPDTKKIIEKLQDPGKFQKLSINDRRELVHTLVQNASTGKSMTPEDLTSTLELIKKSPLTYREQGSLVSKLFENNNRVFLNLDNAKTLDDKYGKITKVYEAYKNNPTVLNKINSKSPTLSLYIKGADGLQASLKKSYITGNPKRYNKLFNETFSIHKHLIDNPKLLKRLDLNNFQWDMFPKFDELGTEINPNLFTDNSSKLVKKVLKDKSLMEIFVKNPSLLKDDKFGKVFNNSIEILLAKASKDEVLAKYIVENIDSYGLNTINQSQFVKVHSFQNKISSNYFGYGDIIEFRPNGEVWKLANPNDTIPSFRIIDGEIKLSTDLESKVRIVDGKIVNKEDNLFFDVKSDVYLTDDSSRARKELTYVDLDTKLEVTSSVIVNKREGINNELIYEIIQVKKTGENVSYKKLMNAELPGGISINNGVVSGDMKSFFTDDELALQFEITKDFSIETIIVYDTFDSFERSFKLGTENGINYYGLPGGNQRIFDKTPYLKELKENLYTVLNKNKISASKNGVIFDNVNLNSEKIAKIKDLFDATPSFDNYGANFTDVPLYKSLTDDVDFVKYLDLPAAKTPDAEFIGHVKKLAGKNVLRDNISADDLYKRLKQTEQNIGDKIGLTMGEARSLHRMYQTEDFNFFEFVDHPFLQNSNNQRNNRLKFLAEITNNIDDNPLLPSNYWEKCIENMMINLEDVINENFPLQSFMSTGDIVKLQEYFSLYDPRLGTISNMTLGDLDVFLGDILKGENSYYKGKMRSLVSPYRNLHVTKANIQVRKFAEFENVFGALEDSDGVIINLLQSLDDELDLDLDLFAKFQSKNITSKELTDSVNKIDTEVKKVIEDKQNIFNDLESLQEKLDSIDNKNISIEQFREYMELPENSNLKTLVENIESNFLDGLGLSNKQYLVEYINSNLQRSISTLNEVNKLKNVVPQLDLIAKSKLTNILNTFDLPKKYTNIFGALDDMKLKFNKYKDDFLTLHEDLFGFKKLDEINLNDVLFNYVINNQNLKQYMNFNSQSMNSIQDFYNLSKEYGLSTSSQLKLAFSVSENNRPKLIEDIFSDKMQKMMSKYKCVV